MSNCTIQFNLFIGSFICQTIAVPFMKIKRILDPLKGEHVACRLLQGLESRLSKLKLYGKFLHGLTRGTNRGKHRNSSHIVKVKKILGRYKPPYSPFFPPIFSLRGQRKEINRKPLKSHGLRSYLALASRMGALFLSKPMSCSILSIITLSSNSLPWTIRCPVTFQSKS